MPNKDAPEAWKAYEARRKFRHRTSKRVPPAAIEALLRTPVAFEEWLARHDEEAVVGDFYTPDNSPLANFLWDALGVHVLTGEAIFDGRSFLPLPAWCSKFELRAVVYGEGRGGDTYLGAGECLKVLQELTKEE